MASQTRRASAADLMKRRLADSFTRATGYRLQKVQTAPAPSAPAAVGPHEPLPPPTADQASGVPLARLQEIRTTRGDRLLEAPTFVLSSIRSGSTLLRVILNTHSQIHAPHELHLRKLSVQLADKYVTRAMREIGLNRDELQFLLWDRLLHREMVRHGKQRVVNKTPGDAFIWRRILRAWPDAKFIFLLRHPAAVVDSWQKARPDWTRDRVAEDVLRFMVAVESVRQQHDGLTVRYEDLTRQPELETRRICEFIGVDWEEQMLNYGEGVHGRFRAGLGDWSAKIKSGEIQPVTELPPDDAVPVSLREITAAWGYLNTSSPV
jgi:Sulfotransferase family